MKTLTIYNLVAAEDLQPLDEALTQIRDADAELIEIEADGSVKVMIRYEGRYQTSETETVIIDSDGNWPLNRVVEAVQGEVNKLLSDVAEPLEY